MKTHSCQPKVIIHRLGAQPPARRRLSPAAILVVLLALAALAGGTVRSGPDGANRLRHLSSLR
jgi:hypothetical protein